MTQKDCIILNTEEGKVQFISFDDTQDIEEILFEQYDLSPSNIEYLVVDKLIVERL